MARTKAPQTHAELAEKAIEEMAADAQTSTDAVYDNELERSVWIHLRAGLILKETRWQVGARYEAPHGFETHCDLCCSLYKCPERTDLRVPVS